MKRKLSVLTAAAVMLLSLTSCGTSSQSSSVSSSTPSNQSALILSDSGVTLNGQTVSDTGAVTVSHDIIYYEVGKGTDYGEGTTTEEHSAEDAAAHTVVTIREAGTYRVSGSLLKGQLAIDLGEDAKTDPNAVVTLVLDNVNITCTVAPALIFYNVYECDTNWVTYDSSGSDAEYDALTQVDTTAAGANIILADDSENTFTGSHVARIYKEGTTDKLYKFDGAFYSKMSMNISGENEGTGILNVVGDNEGIDSELHLTINSGHVNVQSQDDGINTNEDNVSVTTINGGTIQINAGLGAEGDGIDSNGYLVINGGELYTMANETSPDGGLDSDHEILLNGGFIVAIGTDNSEISSDSQQNWMELTFASPLSKNSKIELSDTQGNAILSFTTVKSCASLLFSSNQLQKDVAYTLTVNGTVQQYTGTQSSGFAPDRGGQPSMEKPDGNFDPNNLPEGSDSSKQPDSGQRPDGQEPPELPDNQQSKDSSSSQQMPQKGENAQQPPQMPNNAGGATSSGEASTEFNITDSVCTFSGISDKA